MSNPLSVDLSAGPQPYGVLAFRGPDAAKFLQGQLSADVDALASGSSIMAGFHNAQGRALALLMLARLSPEDIFAVLPAELAGDVEARLRKLVFRSKVTIETPLLRPLGAAAGADPFGSYAFAWGSRQLLLAPTGRGPETGADIAAWELEDVCAGLPQVYTATREQFVAQMLNLDLLGAVSFDKGCYTGQEVIARAHYRGRVKRRLQRWHNASGTPLKPGDAARAPDGRGLAVVRVAGTDAGQEILAVGAYDAADAQSAPATADAAAVTVSGPLPLPYALPAN